MLSTVPAPTFGILGGAGVLPILIGGSLLYNTMMVFALHPTFTLKDLIKICAS